MMVKQLTADEIKAWRAETGLSQQAFAEMLGISRPTVARLEGGEISADPWLYYARVGWQAENGRSSSIATQLEGIIRQIVREENGAMNWYSITTSDLGESDVKALISDITKEYVAEVEYQKSLKPNYPIIPHDMLYRIEHPGTGVQTVFFTDSEKRLVDRTQRWKGRVIKLMEMPNLAGAATIPIK